MSMSKIFMAESVYNKSDVLIQNCLNMPRPLLIEEFQFKIEKWIAQTKNNRALLIPEEEGNDLHCVLVHWMQSHHHKHKDIVIPYFVEYESQNFYSYIYFVMIKLRALLNITQKVELEQQKLKQYFEYWLNMCGRELRDQLYDTQQSYNRIILVVKCVDHFRDSTGEVRASSWLPKLFPDNIKLIVTAKPDSKAFEYFSSGKEPPLLDLSSMQSRCFTDQINQYVGNCKNALVRKGYSKVDATMRNQIFFNKSYFGILSNNDDQYTELIELIVKLSSEIHSEIDLFKLLIKCFLQTFKDPQYPHIFSILAMVHRGITIDEMQQITTCTQMQYECLYNFFKQCLMCSNQVYSIYITSFKHAIQQTITMEQHLNKQFIYVFEHSDNSLRRLEELTYHFKKNKRYLKLKELLTNIENFLLLWNPINKFQFCQYWEALESHSFDLVIEYNKSIETFQAVFKPTPEGLFYVMMQICRFLREFANFEKKFTPHYKHPLLKGQQADFEEVGLYQEISQLKMQSTEKVAAVHLNEDYFPKAPGRLSNPNLELKPNREQLINQYMKLFDQTLLQEYLQTKSEFILDKLINKTKINEQQQFYYYKRWIWVQFPWLCLTTKSNFSNTMKNYILDQTKFMSVEEELLINQKALKFVYNFKPNKTERSFSTNQANQTKLPEVDQPLSNRPKRYFSPIGNKKIITNTIKLRVVEPTNTHLPAIPNAEYKLNQGGNLAYKKKLDQVLYQNQVLQNRLVGLKTRCNNLDTSSISNETQKYMDIIQSLEEEVRKQQEAYQATQNEMRRVSIILKLCQQNADRNEEKVQNLAKYIKNIDRLMADLSMFIIDHNESVQKLKQQRQSFIVTNKDKSLLKSLRNLPNSASRMDPQSPQNITSLYFPQFHRLNDNSMMLSVKKVNHSQFRERSNSARKLDLSQIKEHQQSADPKVLFNQLKELGIENPYCNPIFSEFCTKLQKQQELQFLIQNNEVKLKETTEELNDQKQILKIHKNNYKPKAIKEQEHFDIESVSRHNQKQIQVLKDLQTMVSSQKLFIQSLGNILNCKLKPTSQINDLVPLMVDLQAANERGECCKYNLPYLDNI